MKECVYLQQQQHEPHSKCRTFVNRIVAAAAPARTPLSVTSPAVSSPTQQQQQCTELKEFSIDKMPCWYFDKKELRDTPSIQDGISYDTERRYRKEGARFIMSCGTQMGLGHNTMATGVVYFHRFYMFHSFKSFPRYVTACCCLFLAGKVEETPKKCRDIIKTARGLLSDNYFYSFGEDPKEEVMTLERILLQTIKFDLQVEHPYTFLLKYAKCFKGDQQKLQKMVQMAWNFVNDSLSTVVCLQWEPEIIAVALIHLASKLSKFTVVDWVGRQPQHLRWWDMFVSDVTMEILEDICHQVLDLYQTNQKDGASETQSPPQKPPSRADSPTPMKGITSVGSAGSPAAVKTKSAINSQPSMLTELNNAAGVAAVAASTVSNISISSNMSSSGLNNIQAIKSLVNTGAPVTGGGLPSSSSVNNVDVMQSAMPPSAYHMYAPPPPVNAHPHQMHGMYGGPSAPPPPGTNAGGGGAVPPPLPPPSIGGGYGAPQAAANAWPPSAMANSHYGGVVPPPPMPPGPPPQGAPGGGAVGGYYQGGGGGGGPQYGRQQRY